MRTRETFRLEDKSLPRPSAVQSRNCLWHSAKREELMLCWSFGSEAPQGVKQRLRANLYLEFWRELPVLLDRQDSLCWCDVYSQADCQPSVSQLRRVELCLEKVSLTGGKSLVVVARIVCLKPTDTCTGMPCLRLQTISESHLDVDCLKAVEASQGVSTAHQHGGTLLSGQRHH